ncbi:MAG: DinB family protein, partial [Pseudomonadota bacterium]
MLTERYRSVRSASLEIINGLLPEDLCLQAMADTSPLKWHLAHTTWFFETFILKQASDNYSSFNETFEYLFNSYYNAIGEQYSRPKRHLLSRPTVDEVLAYRHHVDDNMVALSNTLQSLDAMLHLGLHHEQQHQELMLTDLKYNLYQHPFPIQYNQCPLPQAIPIERRWHHFDGCQYNAGYS